MRPVRSPDHRVGSTLLAFHFAPRLGAWSSPPDDSNATRLQELSEPLDATGHPPTRTRRKVHEALGLNRIDHPPVIWQPVSTTTTIHDQRLPSRRVVAGVADQPGPAGLPRLRSAVHPPRRPRRGCQLARRGVHHGPPATRHLGVLPAIRSSPSCRSSAILSPRGWCWRRRASTLCILQQSAVSNYSACV